LNRNLGQWFRERFPGISRFIAARFDREAELGLELTVALLIIALLLWSFVELSAAFPRQGAFDTLDVRVISWLHQRETPAGVMAWTAVSWFGSIGLILVSTAVAITFAARGSWLKLLVWTFAAGGVAILNQTLKFAFQRARPEFAPDTLRLHSWSFPSGHAMDSLVVYGLLAYLVLERVKWPALRRLIVVGAGLFVAAIGVSRLYLGVHYPSDVIAGFLAGGAWLTACVLAYQLARSRRPKRIFRSAV
jgi:undecaprenyl-diphosphatase